MQKYVVKNIARPDIGYIEKFKEYDVSTVYEAQGKTGLLSSRITNRQEGRDIVGPVVTAVCYAGDNLMIHAAIEVCKPGDILVVSIIGESEHGMIGELIVSALIKRGVKGLIIDAGIRDIAQIKKLGFPIWSKAIYSQGTTKNTGGWVNSQCVCGDITIDSGDLIMADDDGVVVVDKNYEKCLLNCKKRMEKEKSVKEKISDGKLSLDFYNLRGILKEAGVNYFENKDQIFK